MKHKNHQADLSQNIGLILRVDARNKNAAMYRVVFEKGFTMSNVSCVDCGIDFSYFTFWAQNFTLNDGVINTLD